MSERRQAGVGARLARALLAVSISLAPSSVPVWRTMLRFRPVAVEFVGEPTPALGPRPHR